MSKVINLTNRTTQKSIANKLHNKLGYSRTIESNTKSFKKMNEIKRNGYIQQYVDLFGERS